MEGIWQSWLPNLDIQIAKSNGLVTIRILKQLGDPQTMLNMNILEEELLKFSNDIRIQHDLSITEMQFIG
jgi:hypothetical protein